MVAVLFMKVSGAFLCLHSFFHAVDCVCMWGYIHSYTGFMSLMKKMRPTYCRKCLNIKYFSHYLGTLTLCAFISPIVFLCILFTIAR